MTRGAKIVVFSVVGLFVLAGIYYGFLAPKGPTNSLTDSLPKVSETPTLTISPTPVLTQPNGQPIGGLAVKGIATGTQTGFPAVSGPAFAPSTGGPIGKPAVAGQIPAVAGQIPAVAGQIPVPPVAQPATLTTGETSTLLNSPEPWLPTAPAAPAAPTKKVATVKAQTQSFTVYTVESGDTLTAIAGEWFKDTNKWKEIVAVNPGLSASNLKIGQKINLPARAGSASGKMPSGTATKTAQASLSLANEHVVVSGETLASIADKAYGSRVNWKKIYEANKTVIGENPSALKVGMKLTIPGKQS